MDYYKKYLKYKHKYLKLLKQTSSMLGGAYKQYDIIPYENIDVQKINCNDGNIIGSGSFGRVIGCDYDGIPNVFIEKTFTNLENYTREIQIGQIHKETFKICKILYPIAKNNKSILYLYKGITLDNFMKQLVNDAINKNISLENNPNIIFNNINIVIQILKDLACLYGKNIINTDLKSRNVVIMQIKHHISDEFISANNLFLYKDFDNNIHIASLTLIDIDSFTTKPNDIQNVLNIQNVPTTNGINSALWTLVVPYNVLSDVPPLYGIASIISLCLLYKQENIVKNAKTYVTIYEYCKKLSTELANIINNCVMHDILHYINPYEYLYKELEKLVPFDIASISLHEAIQLHNNIYTDQPASIRSTNIISEPRQQLTDINVTDISSQDNSRISPELLSAWNKLPIINATF